jgi:hypothetical protein
MTEDDGREPIEDAKVLTSDRLETLRVSILKTEETINHLLDSGLYKNLSLYQKDHFKRLVEFMQRYRMCKVEDQDDVLRDYDRYMARKLPTLLTIR